MRPRHIELRDPVSLSRRLRARIELDANGCWLWTGFTGKSGYARIRDRMQYISAHRAAYLLFVGEIPDGLEIDHLCRVRHCVNPAHLEPVTTAQNLLRSANPFHKAHLAGTCTKGHPITTNPRTGKRICYPCQRVYFAAYRERRRKAAAVCRGLNERAAA